MLIFLLPNAMEAPSRLLLALRHPKLIGTRLRASYETSRRQMTMTKFCARNNNNRNVDTNPIGPTKRLNRITYLSQRRTADSKEQGSPSRIRKGECLKTFWCELTSKDLGKPIESTRAVTANIHGHIRVRTTISRHACVSRLLAHDKIDGCSAPVPATKPLTAKSAKRWQPGQSARFYHNKDPPLHDGGAAFICGQT